jgi:hypothetical protein
MAKPQVSYYINVAQTLGITGGLLLGFRALRLEERRAGIERRPVKEVITEDVRRVRNWWEDNFRYKQYTHR